MRCPGNPRPSRSRLSPPDAVPATRSHCPAKLQAPAVRFHRLLVLAAVVRAVGAPQVRGGGRRPRAQGVGTLQLAEPLQVSVDRAFRQVDLLQFRAKRLLVRRADLDRVDLPFVYDWPSDHEHASLPEDSTGRVANHERFPEQVPGSRRILSLGEDVRDVLSFEFLRRESGVWRPVTHEEHLAIAGRVFASESERDEGAVDRLSRGGG